MIPERARWAPALLFLLACACSPPPASPADGGENPVDASALGTDAASVPSDASGLPDASGVAPDASALPDAAGDAPDAAGLPDAGEQDGGSSDAGACPGQGGYPAVDPAHAYADLEGLRDQALRDALFGLVKDHVSLTYNDARRAIRDTVDNHGGQLECIYTGLTLEAATAFTSGMNVEHTWPQSEMGAALAQGEADLNHLFPSESDFNLRRSSWPFADTACDARGDCLWSKGGSNIDYAPGSTSDRIVEVRPERRGDVARAHFYFSVRYELPIDAAEERVLRCWNWSDPPDAEERARNGRVEAIQTKRNPFVDRPDFVERIADF
ncbi:MAG TPA: endonuclease [Myxococcales bacterium]|jgi:endonuclease I